MRPVVVTVAITGSIACKKDNPAVPISVSEQIESTHEAFDAGASVVHIHVRNANETPSADPELFAKVMEGVRRHCPDMIVQFSTDGAGRDPAARGAALHLGPDMATLSPGPVHRPGSACGNSAFEELATRIREQGVRPEVEVSDLSTIHGARMLADRGLIDHRAHVQLILGVRNSLPPTGPVLDIMLGELRRELPKASWSAVGLGRRQADVIEWALARGADGVRTGLEDGVRIGDRLANSNAELVEHAIEKLARHDARAARPAEARALFGLAAIPRPRKR